MTMNRNKRSVAVDDKTIRRLRAMLTNLRALVKLAQARGIEVTLHEPVLTIKQEMEL